MSQNWKSNETLAYLENERTASQFPWSVLFACIILTLSFSRSLLYYQDVLQILAYYTQLIIKLIFCISSVCMYPPRDKEFLNEVIWCM